MGLAHARVGMDYRGADRARPDVYHQDSHADALLLPGRYLAAVRLLCRGAPSLPALTAAALDRRGEVWRQ